MAWAPLSRPVASRKRYWPVLPTASAGPVPSLGVGPEVWDHGTTFSSVAVFLPAVQPQVPEASKEHGTTALVTANGSDMAARTGTSSSSLSAPTWMR